MTATKRTPKIHPGLKALLDGCKNRQRIDGKYRTEISIRVSAKQLWFFAYRSKELTGKPFTCEGPLGMVDYPTGFNLGTWEDGSSFGAECTKNKVNGPFWITYTETLTIEA